MASYRICGQVPAIALIVATLGSPGPAHTAEPRPSLAGIWLPDPTRSERPRDLPYTKTGRAAVDAFRATHDPVKDDPGAFCLPAGMPQTAMGGADYPVEIIVTARQVTMLFELHQQVRRIFLEAEHPSDLFPQRNGHSIGRWEKDTLTVDTTAVKGAPYGAVPHSDQARIQERLRVSDDGKSLFNEITIIDPTMYTRPVIAKQYYTAAPSDLRMLEYDCTEGMWADHEKQRARGK